MSNLVEILIELVATYATQNDETLDSNGVSALAEAMRYLASIDVWKSRKAWVIV